MMSVWLHAIAIYLSTLHTNSHWIANTTLIRTSDVLAASVDDLAFFLDFKILQRVHRGVFKICMNLGNADSTYGVCISRTALEAVKELINISKTDLNILFDVAVEMKTTTNENRVNEYKLSIQKARKIDNRSECFWFCTFDDGVYKALVPSQHRIQLQHHTALLGVRTHIMLSHLQSQQFTLFLFPILIL